MTETKGNADTTWKWLAEHEIAGGMVALNMKWLTQK
jgi:hypothetical protein